MMRRVLLVGEVEYKMLGQDIAQVNIVVEYKILGQAIARVNIFITYDHILF